jgi:hypothetical protein
MKASALLPIGLVLGMASQLGAQDASQQPSSSPSPAAQGSVTSATPNCDYNACALRVKIAWGNRLIIRGQQEQQVGKLGMFSANNLESLVASSQEAAAEARIFQKNHKPGEILLFLGTFTMVFSASVASGSESAVGPIAGVAAGISMLFYGVFQRVRADNSLSKTIWLYNRSLQR